MKNKTIDRIAAIFSDDLLCVRKTNLYIIIEMWILITLWIIFDLVFFYLICLWCFISYYNTFFCCCFDSFWLFDFFMDEVLRAEENEVLKIVMITHILFSGIRNLQWHWWQGSLLPLGTTTWKPGKKYTFFELIDILLIIFNFLGKHKRCYSFLHQSTVL